jgi:hypothetical protein
MRTLDGGSRDPRAGAADDPRLERNPPRLARDRRGDAVDVTRDAAVFRKIHARHSGAGFSAYEAPEHKRRQVSSDEDARMKFLVLRHIPKKHITISLLGDFTLSDVRGEAIKYIS